MLTVFALTRWWTGYALQSSSWMELILPMPGRLFWIWIYVCLVVQFPPEFVMNGTVLVLVWSVSLFWMAVSPSVLHVGYTYLNLLDSPGLLRVFMTLAAVVGPLLPNFLARAIAILNFIRCFRNFIADTVPCWKKYSVSMKTLLQQGMSEPEFYGDLVYRFRKIVGRSGFSEQFGGGGGGCLLTVVEELAAAWMLCGKLQA